MMLVYKKNDIEHAIKAESFAEIVVALKYLDGPMSFKEVYNEDTKETYSAYDILTINESYKEAKDMITAIETIFR